MRPASGGRAQGGAFPYGHIPDLPSDSMQHQAYLVFPCPRPQVRATMVACHTHGLLASRIMCIPIQHATHVHAYKENYTEPNITST